MRLHENRNEYRKRTQAKVLTQTKSRANTIVGVLIGILLGYACILATQPVLANPTNTHSEGKTDNIATETSVFIGQQGLHIDPATLPQNGMTMGQVEAAFGQALKKTPEVGTPPISRWEYDQYTIYFEHDLVLHVVVHPLTS